MQAERIKTTKSNIDELLDYYEGKNQIDYVDEDEIYYWNSKGTWWNDYLKKHKYNHILVAYKKDQEDNNGNNVIVFTTHFRVLTVFSEAFPGKGNPNTDCIIEIDPTLADNSVWYKDISGRDAYFEMRKTLSKKLSKEQIDERLKSYSIKDEEAVHQIHKTIMEAPEKVGIERHDGVYYCDINNAHGDAWLEMFPECKDEFEYMSKHKKDTVKGIKGYYKKVFNLSIGYLKRGGYAGTYWWVVNRTSHKLLDYIKQYRGDIIYANTDGVIMRVNTPYMPQSSNEIGQFKVKYGTVYTYERSYRNRPKDDYSSYSVHQFIDMNTGEVETKGTTVPDKLKHLIDLQNGVTIKWKTNVINHRKRYSDINKEVLPIYEY